MPGARHSHTYQATDSIGTVYTTYTKRPRAFCVVFTGGVGHVAWANGAETSEKTAAQKRRIAKVPGTILTGLGVEILDAIEVETGKRKPLSGSQRQAMFRERRDAQAASWWAALEAVSRASTLAQARNLALVALETSP